MKMLNVLIDTTGGIDKLSNGEYGLYGIILSLVIIALVFLVRFIIKIIDKQIESAKSALEETEKRHREERNQWQTFIEKMTNSAQKNADAYMMELKGIYGEARQDSEKLNTRWETAVNNNTSALIEVKHAVELQSK